MTWFLTSVINTIAGVLISLTPAVHTSKSTIETFAISKESTSNISLVNFDIVLLSKSTKIYYWKEIIVLWALRIGFGKTQLRVKLIDMLTDDTSWWWIERSYIHRSYFIYYGKFYRLDCRNKYEFDSFKSLNGKILLICINHTKIYFLTLFYY